MHSEGCDRGAPLQGLRIEGKTTLFVPLNSSFALYAFSEFGRCFEPVEDETELIDLGTSSTRQSDRQSEKFRQSERRDRHPNLENPGYVAEHLFFDVDEQWRVRFSFMLALSVVIATMALLADSAAVVIGAMLVAPLMRPVLALSAALVLSLRKRIFACISIVMGASVGSVLLSWFLSTILPIGDTVVGNEVLSRTSPDIIDLLIGLAAGAAGAYATVRKDVSSSLPGVAVAVALVPPLATAGIMLDWGEYELVRGAIMLYLANLVAIVLAGVLVFLATGFVSEWTLKKLTPRILLNLVILTIVTMVLAVPLTYRLVDTLQETDLHQATWAAVREWVGESPFSADVQIDNINRDGIADKVVVELAGSGNPPLVDGLKNKLVKYNALGEDGLVEVHFLQKVKGGSAEDGAKTLDDIRDFTNKWIKEQPDPKPTLGGVRIDKGSNKVKIVIQGPAPLDQGALVDEITGEISPDLIVSVEWIQTLDLREQEEIKRQNQVRGVSEQWARAHGVAVLQTSVQGDYVLVYLVGETPPDHAASLKTQILEVLGFPENQEAEEQESTLPLVSDPPEIAVRFLPTLDVSLDYPENPDNAITEEEST